MVVELSVLISNGRGKQCFRKSTNIKKYLELKSFYFCYSFFFFFPDILLLYFEYSSFPLSENSYFQNPFRLHISTEIVLAHPVVCSVQQHPHVVVIKCNPLS